MADNVHHHPAAAGDFAFSNKVRPLLGVHGVVIWATIMTEYAELNMNNFNDDDVAQLNQWGIETIAAIEQAVKRLEHEIAICRNVGANGTAHALLETRELLAATLPR